MARSTALAALALIASPASAFFLMPCWPVSTDRIDPIVDPGSMSSHVHQIAGGGGFAPMMDYNTTQAASCTTCFVKGDKSNYWIPALYYQGQDGSFQRVPQVGSASMYYFNEPTRLGPGEKMESFPEGLRMLAGDPDKRSPGTDAASLAINYKCLDYAGVPTDSKTFPTKNCPDGIRAEVTYPSCWDGKNLDSSDHKSHMAYPTGTFESGACPAGYPHHLVTLKVEFIFDTNSFKDQWYGSSQPFVWSQGDPTGYGLHADYIMGWDSALLQSAVEQCFDIYGVLANCAPFDGQLPAAQDSYVNPGTCKVNPYVEEDFGGTVKALPGCNTIQAGPGKAQSVSNCQSSGKLLGNWGSGVSSVLASILPSSSASSGSGSAGSSAPYSASAYAPAGTAASFSAGSYSASQGAFYAKQAGSASSSSTPSVASVAPSSSSVTTPSAAPTSSSSVVSSDRHVHTVTVTDLVTETEYYTQTAEATETATVGGSWSSWKREIGDHGHRHQHRHVRPHRHEQR